MSVLIACICFPEPYFVSKIFSFLFCRRFQNIGNEKPWQGNGGGFQKKPWQGGGGGNGGGFKKPWQGGNGGGFQKKPWQGNQQNSGGQAYSGEITVNDSGNGEGFDDGMPF